MRIRDHVLEILARIFLLMFGMVLTAKPCLEVKLRIGRDLREIEKALNKSTANDIIKNIKITEVN